MKINYDENQTRLFTPNQKELLDYLQRVDCMTETPVDYRSHLHPGYYNIHDERMINNYYLLFIDICQYKTRVSFPIIIADGVNINSLKVQYDSLEVFRSIIKDFFDYIDELGVKCEKEKSYNSTLKKLTPKPPKPKKSKPKKEEDNRNISIINGKKVIWYDDHK